MNRQGTLIIGLLFALFLTTTAESLHAQSLWDGTVSRSSGHKVEPDTYDVVRGIGEQFSNRSQWGQTVGVLACILLLLVLAASLAVLDGYWRRRNKAIIDNPRYLFTELVRAHELTRIERQFLINFANEKNLEDPLPLFIEPQYFQSALDDDQFSESYPMIDYLLKKLFDIEDGRFGLDGKVAERTSPVFGTTTIFHPQGKHDKR